MREKFETNREIQNKTREKKKRKKENYFRRAKSIAAKVKKPQLHAPEITKPNHTLK